MSNEWMGREKEMQNQDGKQDEMDVENPHDSWIHILRDYGWIGVVWLLFSDQGGRTPWATTALGLATLIIAAVALFS